MSMAGPHDPLNAPSMLKKILKALGALAAVGLLAATIFVVNLVWFRPFSLNLFYEKVFISFLLQDQVGWGPALPPHQLPRAKCIRPAAAAVKPSCSRVSKTAADSQRHPYLPITGRYHQRMYQTSIHAIPCSISTHPTPPQLALAQSIATHTISCSPPDIACTPALALCTPHHTTP